LFISYGELNDEDDEFWIINKKPVWNITGFFIYILVTIW
jgi:hypothetical protein